MENQKFRQTAFTNLIWRFAERSGAQLVSFVVSIFLARVLEPDIYGTVAIITVITAILQVFVDSGFGNALIQKKDADDLDFSSVFYFNCVTCVILYALLYFFAPYIAAYYNMEILTRAIRVLGLTLVISGVKNIQQAYVSRHLMFRKFFFSTLAGTLGAAVVGIYMAYQGYGIWALVCQGLFNQIVDTLLLWFTVKWRPKCAFSLHRFRMLFSFGWKLLVSELVNTIYVDLRQLMIGKIYTSADLAYFNRGQQIPNALITNINASIDSVLLPVMSRQQDSMESVKGITRRAIKTSTYVLWPCMIGLMATAVPLVRLVLTEKWLSCVPYLRIFCLTYAFTPMQTANLNAIKAMGRSDIYIWLEVIKKTFGILLLLAVMRMGVFAIAASLLLYTAFALLVNMTPNVRLLGYTHFEQIRDILPAMAMSALMGSVVYPISFLPLPDVLRLVLQVAVGVIIYVALSYLLRLETFMFLLTLLKSFQKRESKS